MRITLRPIVGKICPIRKLDNLHQERKCTKDCAAFFTQRYEMGGEEYQSCLLFNLEK